MAEIRRDAIFRHLRNEVSFARANSTCNKAWSQDAYTFSTDDPTVAGKLYEALDRRVNATGTRGLKMAMKLVDGGVLIVIDSEGSSEVETALVARFTQDARSCSVRGKIPDETLRSLKLPERR
ncbi:MAG: hypothetical protein ACR2RB_20110 [Gammaproteobacteria bacterium]